MNFQSAFYASGYLNGERGGPEVRGDSFQSAFYASGYLNGMFIVLNVNGITFFQSAFYASGYLNMTFSN